MKTIEKYLNERNPESGFSSFIRSRQKKEGKIQAVIVWHPDYNLKQIQKLLSPIIKKGGVINYDLKEI